MPETPKMKMYLLPEDVRNGVIEYLQGCPFKDVAGGIGKLLALEELPSLPPPPVLEATK